MYVCRVEMRTMRIITTARKIVFVNYYENGVFFVVAETQSSKKDFVLSITTALGYEQTTKLGICTVDIC